MKAAEAAYASLKVPGNPTENGDVAARASSHEAGHRDILAMACLNLLYLHKLSGAIGHPVMPRCERYAPQNFEVACGSHRREALCRKRGRI
jgi:hypothetical protein